MEYFENLVKGIRGLSLKDMVSSVKLNREIMYRKLFPGDKLSIGDRCKLQREKDKMSRLLFFLSYGLKYRKMPTGVSEGEKIVYRLLLEDLVRKKEIDKEILGDINGWLEARME